MKIKKEFIDKTLFEYYTLNCEESSITETTSFKDDLGADSLDLFELVMALEEKYEVEIPSEELAELTTVGAVMEYLKNKGVEA